MNLNKLVIGEVLKPQGIKGELKIRPYVDDVQRYKSLKEVYIDEVAYKVLSVRISVDAIFVSLSQIADRTMAESYRGKLLTVSREDAIPLEDGRYFIADLLGAKVYLDDGSEVGIIKDITSSNVDIFSVERNDKKMVLFPFLKDSIVSVDTDNKKVILKSERFKQISVED